MGDDHFNSAEQIQAQPLLFAIRQQSWRIPFVVDQTGVEPVSKDRSNVLLLSYPVFQIFPLALSPRQTHALGISLYAHTTGENHMSFPAFMTPYPPDAGVLRAASGIRPLL